MVSNPHRSLSPVTVAVSFSFSPSLHSHSLAQSRVFSPPLSGDSARLTRLAQGHEIAVVDNFFTGRKKNVEHWIGHPNFELINHDVTMPLYLQVDEIYHLASPASPPHYQHNPVRE